MNASEYIRASIERVSAELLSRARKLLVLDQEFFAGLVLELRLVVDWSQKTGATDGSCVYYNPEWVAGLDVLEVMGFLAHEAMHCALGHAWRRGGRDPMRWNIAADYTINNRLIEAGMSLPTGCLCKDYDGAAEEIESRLPPLPQDLIGAPVIDPGGCGAVIDAPGSEAEVVSLEHEWRIRVSQSAGNAREAGRMPASCELWVTEVVAPEVGVGALLRDFVERSARNDYNWARPSRRHIHRGFVLPGLVSDELPSVVIVLDTSGSIDQRTYDRFAALVSETLDAYDTTVYVLYVDTKVQNVQVFTRDDLPLKLEARGRGGTDFAPAFEWVVRESLEPSCLVYLTDLEGSFPAEAPDYPVLWVTPKDVCVAADAPFGSTIRF